MALRFATLTACAVEVGCPFCGELQPSPNGSEMWEPHEVKAAALARPNLEGRAGERTCVSCDKAFIVNAHNKALVEYGPAKVRTR